MNLPPISKPLTATELRDRAVAAMNGESVQLSPTDSERRSRVLQVLHDARKGRDG